jgi:hypothetical protein
MIRRKGLFRASCALLITLFADAVTAQEERGKADLKAPGGSIIVDYGRPSLQGRDMLSKLAVGNYWRLGKNEITVLSTPVPLVFGAIRIPKGNHGLWLKRSGVAKFELVFNGQVTGHGMVHDAKLDVAAVPMSKSALPNPVEILTIELQAAPGGGRIAVNWGGTRLTAGFQFAK